ncbi:hypothetical protein MBOT_27090 [Mycobacterium botniense]|uniref:Uncharacterized protein n=1 Tax=Mycobacterium botniense TaxID=84962 RepID=A0A7I9XZY3_9MYCO|nr:hypothetical protein MBOT_27090 [Mycobacterium botniense]
MFAAVDARPGVNALASQPRQGSGTPGDMRRQILLSGHRRREIAQSVPVSGAQTDGEPLFVPACQFDNLAQQLLSRRGEVEGMQSAIVRIAATLDIATLLELIDRDHHMAGQHPRSRTEGLSAAAGLCAGGGATAFTGANRPVAWCEHDHGRREACDADCGRAAK